MVVPLSVWTDCLSWDYSNAGIDFWPIDSQDSNVLLKNRKELLFGYTELIKYWGNSIKWCILRQKKMTLAVSKGESHLLDMTKHLHSV